MSFGVAFAFPAYDNPPNVGPFTQAGPTLDLLFTGLPAVDNTFVGSSLSLDFLTQQYQLPAQYSVWVAGQGLTAKTFSDLITFTRASTATFVGSDGLVQTAAINAPRFDYNPTTFFPNGFLIEAARTNSILYSEQIDNAAWVKVRSSITANAIAAPDGALTADKIVIDTTAATNHSVGQSLAITSGTTYTWVVYAKVGEFTEINLRFSAQFPSGNTFFNLLTGVITNIGGISVSSMVPAGNNWYRCSITQTANGTGAGQPQVFIAQSGSINIATANGTDGVYVWGAQLEAGEFPTSYIPTTAAPVPREADLAAINTLSPWFNSAQGTLFAQFEASPNTYTAYVDISNGVTAQNSIHIDNDTGLMRAVYYSGSAPVATLSLGAIGTVGTVNKVATSYAVNDFRANRNGESIVSDTAGALPVGLTQMNIGADPSGTASNVINGHIQRITYYPRSMPGYELQAITV
jgi:hypothetical protein